MGYTDISSDTESSRGFSVHLCLCQQIKNLVLDFFIFFETHNAEAEKAVVGGGLPALWTSPDTSFALTAIPQAGVKRGQTGRASFGLSWLGGKLQQGKLASEAQWSSETATLVMIPSEEALPLSS